MRKADSLHISASTIDVRDYKGQTFHTIDITTTEARVRLQRPSNRP